MPAKNSEHTSAEPPHRPPLSPQPHPTTPSGIFTPRFGLNPGLVTFRPGIGVRVTEPKLRHRTVLQERTSPHLAKRTRASCQTYQKLSPAHVQNLRRPCQKPLRDAGSQRPRLELAEANTNVRISFAGLCLPEIVFPAPAACLELPFPKPPPQPPSARPHLGHEPAIVCLSGAQGFHLKVRNSIAGWWLRQSNMGQETEGCNCLQNQAFQRHPIQKKRETP